MAYREVRAMDIEQVIRRWTAGEAIRAIARATGLDRNTVRGLIRQAEKGGLKAGEAATEEQLQLIRKGIGQPGAPSVFSESGRWLQPQWQRTEMGVKADGVVSTKHAE